MTDRKELHNLKDKLVAEIWDVIHQEYGKRTNKIALGHKLVEKVNDVFKEALKE